MKHESVNDGQSLKTSKSIRFADRVEELSMSNLPKQIENEPHSSVPTEFKSVE